MLEVVGFFCPWFRVVDLVLAFGRVIIEGVSGWINKFNVVVQFWEGQLVSTGTLFMEITCCKNVEMEE